MSVREFVRKIEISFINWQRECVFCENEKSK